MDVYNFINFFVVCFMVNFKWVVSGDCLFFIFNNDFCECMYKFLICVFLDNFKIIDFGKIFNYVCD